MPLNIKKPDPVFGPRLVGVVVMGFLLIVLSTTLFSWWSVGEAQVQPLTAIVVWAGFNLSVFRGVAVVAILGYMMDSLSGGIVGLQIIVNLAVFYSCVIAQRHLALNNWAYQMIAVGVMSIVSPLIIAGGLMLASRQYLMPQDLAATIFWQAFLTALVAPFIFVALETLIRLLQKIWVRVNHEDAKEF